jgi:MFS family permease
MLNKAAKLNLVATSLAPICLTLWFVEFSKAWDWQAGLKYLLVAVLLSLLCAVLVRLSGKNLEKLPVKIKAVKTVDKEIVGFLLVYLLPLINQTNNTISFPVLVFISLIFFFIVLNTHAYHFNPLLGFFGYHFYEVIIEGDITYVLITRKNIADCKSITQIVQLTEYMILETNNA